MSKNLIYEKNGTYQIHAKTSNGAKTMRITEGRFVEETIRELESLGYTEFSVSGGKVLKAIPLDKVFNKKGAEWR